MSLQIIEKRRKLDLFSNNFFIEGNLEYYKRCNNKIIRQRTEHSDNQTLVIDNVNAVFICRENNCQQCFESLVQYEVHKFKAHKYRCSICSKSFSSDRLLSIHLCETHDTYFKLMSNKKPSYECLVEECLQVFWTSDLRRHHLIQHHLFPLTYDLPKSKKCHTKYQTKIQETVISMNHNCLGGDRKVELNHCNSTKSSRSSRRAILKTKYDLNIVDKSVEFNNTSDLKMDCD